MIEASFATSICRVFGRSVVHKLMKGGECLIDDRERIDANRLVLNGYRYEQCVAWCDAAAMPDNRWDAQMASRSDLVPTVAGLNHDRLLDHRQGDALVGLPVEHSNRSAVAEQAVTADRGYAVVVLLYRTGIAEYQLR